MRECLQSVTGKRTLSKERSRENVREGMFTRKRVRESVRERTFAKGDEVVNAREGVSRGAVFRATVALRHAGELILIGSVQNVILIWSGLETMCDYHLTSTTLHNPQVFETELECNG